MKRSTVILVLLIILIGTHAFAQEKIQQTTPVAQPSITDYVVGDFYVMPQRTTPVVQRPRISVTLLRVPDGKGVAVSYPCTNGCTAMDTDAKVQNVIDLLNSSVNMATRSLQRRILDRIVIDFPELFPGGATVQ